MPRAGARRGFRLSCRSTATTLWAEAASAARAATLFVLPSVDEALGVAYLEAMAGGVPAVGCRGEAGPEEIAAAGGGIVLVPPRSPAALAETIDALLSDRAGLHAL